MSFLHLATKMLVDEGKVLRHSLQEGSFFHIRPLNFLIKENGAEIFKQGRSGSEFLPTNPAIHGVKATVLGS